MIKILLSMSFLLSSSLSFGQFFFEQIPSAKTVAQSKAFFKERKRFKYAREIQTIRKLVGV